MSSCREPEHLLWKNVNSIIHAHSSPILEICWSSDDNYIASCSADKRVTLWDIYNGNYLIMSSQGIYLYNEEFNSKISLVIFENRLAESNNHIYSSDIAQFSKDDNGYIICLIKNETYILSKTGSFLQHIKLDYVNLDWNYRIIPYGHNNNEFYYVIISINTYSKSIVIRKYIYNSSSNNVILEFTKDYSHSVELKQGISCQLMTILSGFIIWSAILVKAKELKPKLENIIHANTIIAPSKQTAT